MHEERDSNKYIAELLDIEHYYGVSEGRLMPTIIFLFVGLAPAFVYLYYSLYLYIPLFISLPLWLIWLIRSAMIIIGREKERINQFKERLLDKFQSISRIIRVKTIHPDGCVEMLSGVVKYYVVCYNKTIDSIIDQSVQLRQFQESLIGKYDFDIIVQNLTSIDAIEDRYDTLDFKGNTSIAEDFIEIIDYNRNIVNKSSKLTRTVYVIRGTKSEWKNIKSQIESTLNSEAVKSYKTAYVLTDRLEIEKLMSRDINGDIDIDKLTVEKYKTNDFHGNKVNYYDELVEDNNKETEDVVNSFHVRWEDR